jgi:hypothetical protein
VPDKDSAEKENGCKEGGEKNYRLKLYSLYLPVKKAHL